MSNPIPQRRLGGGFREATRSVTWPFPFDPANPHRIVAGADTPLELQSYGILEAILWYVTDKVTHQEWGYFFMGQTNSIDFGADDKACLWGSVLYPTPGNPSSPTAADVKTHVQIDMFGSATPGAGYTIFKDMIFQLNATVPQALIKTPDWFNIDCKQHYQRTNATDECIGTANLTDTQERWELLANGDMGWGPGGAAVRDIHLARKAAGTASGSGVVLQAAEDVEILGTTFFTGPNKRGIVKAGPNVNTGANAYIDITGTSFTFVKRYAGTQLMIHLATSWYTNNASGSIAIAVSVNGTDHQVGQMLGSNHLDRNHISGFDYLTGVGAGSFTVKGRMKCPSAVGTTNIDANDWCSVECEEVPA